MSKGTDRYIKGTVPDKSSRLPLKKKLFWDWASDILEAGKNGSTNTGKGLCPVIGDDGNLQVAKEDIQRAWVSHFRRLATDDTGIAHSMEAWEARLGPGAMLSELPGLNAEVDWPELRAVFARMNNWKVAVVSRN